MSKVLSVTFQHSSSARPPLQPHLAMLPCQPAGLTISSSGPPRAIFLQSLSLACALLHCQDCTPHLF